MTLSRAVRSRRRFTATAVFALTLVAAACGDDEDEGAADTTVAEPSAASSVPAATSANTSAPVDTAGVTTVPPSSGGEDLSGTLRLGLFPNVTHAPALIGVGDGIFEEKLGDGVSLEPFTFNSGTEATEALFADAIDMSFIGPNPAINAFAQSDGEAVRLISGTTSGGAYLVTTTEITSPEQLEGTTIATPSLGNTQDVALRAWLAENGFETTPEGGGDVEIRPQDNAAMLQAFIGGEIDGAWVPEPWATRLILEGEGQILVDERDLWPDTDGGYVTTHLLVATSYLEENPEIVKAVLGGLLDTLDRIESDSAAAQASVIDQIEEITSERPGEEVVAASFENLTFTYDPIAESLAGSAEDAEAVGLLEPVELAGIYDLALLNELLEERGETPIEAPF